MRRPIEPNSRIQETVFHLVVFFVIVLLGAVIYRNTFDVPLVFDDVFNIVENSAIRNVFDLKPLWRYDPSRFLTHLTFAVNFHLGQLDVYGYHLVNLAVHLLATIAVYLFVGSVLDNPSDLRPVLFRFRRWIAAFSAILFLSHPLQTQAVTYISQRSTPLAALCYLSVLIFYIRFRRHGGWKNYAGALIFAFLGLFTKPIIVTLPVAMVLYEIFFLSRGIPRRKRVWAGLLPFFSMIVIVPALLLLWRDKAFDAGSFLSITRESHILSRGEYFSTQMNVIMMYIKLLFLPVNQKLDYDFPIAKSLLEFPVWLSFWAVTAILYLAVRIYRNHKIISFGLFWVFITLSLESSIFPISDVIFEHRLYLPMVGFALIITYTLSLWTVHKPKIFFIVILLIIAACSTLTFRRNSQWRNALEFYIDMAQRFPNKARILNNLGNYYSERKDWDAALKAYEQALPYSTAEQITGTYNNIANIYGEQGRPDEAIAILEKVLVLDPRFYPAYYNLGLIYMRHPYNDYPRAMAYFTKTLEIDPGSAQALVGIAGVYSAQRQLDKARFYLEQALAINPGYAPTYQDLGQLYLDQQQFGLAIRYYEEALRRRDDLPDVHNNLGNLYLMQGRNDLALEEYKKAIEYAPDFAGAYMNAADLLTKMGRDQEAKRYYQKALELYKELNDGLMMEKIENMFIRNGAGSL